MGVIVPVGEYTSTQVFACAGSTKTPTWSFGFRYIGGGADPSPSDLAATIHDAFLYVGTGADGPYISGAMAVGWSFTAVSVALQTSTGPLVGVDNGVVSGSLTGGAMPINCAILLTKNTALGGRKYKGRAYLPPCAPTEDFVDPAGNLTLGTDVTLQQSYDVVYEQLAAADIEPVLHHSDGSIGTRIESWTVGNTIATQRRRIR